MRTISRTNYLVDEALLGRYNQRTNFAEKVERNIYVDPNEDQAGSVPAARIKNPVARPRPRRLQNGYISQN